MRGCIETHKGKSFRENAMINKIKYLKKVTPSASVRTSGVSVELGGGKWMTLSSTVRSEWETGKWRENRYLQGHVDMRALSS